MTNDLQRPAWFTYGRLAAAVCVLAAAVAGVLFLAGHSKDAHLARGDRYAAQQQYAEAIIEYRNALKKDPKDGTARARLAEAYAVTNDAKNAAHEAILAADLLPDNMDAQVKAGQYELLAGKYDEARARAERVLAKDPLNVTAQLLRGNAAAGLKDFETAINEINAAIEIDSSDVRAFTSLGAIAQSQGRRADAEAAFKQAIDIQPSSAAVQLALANFYWSSGRVKEVEPLLVKAVRFEPRNAIAQRALATYYLSTGRRAEAEAPLKGIVEAVQDIPSRLALADYYIATQRPEEARLVLKIVADYPKGFAAGMVRLAALDYMEKQPEAAHRRLEAVLAKQSKNADALLLKAQFLTRERKFEDAFAAVHAAVGADPHSAAAQQALGTLAAARGQLDASIAAFTEVIKLSPKSIGARIQLGQVHVRKGESAEALSLAGEVLRESPNHAGARSMRAPCTCRAISTALSQP
jgi:tetratricopeptide (TPR) repeat protein